MEKIILDIAILIIGLTTGFFIAKRLYNSKISLHIQEAQAKAQVIELEAKNTLNIARANAKTQLDKEFKLSRNEIEKKKKDVNDYVQTELESLKLDKQLILKIK